MAKFQLTISTNYCADWGVWHGVREVMQNALDAEDDGYPMRVTHSGDTLRVTSDGAKLDARVWLMGTTSKSAETHRGHFGEGLKLGILALVRAGRKVKIINGRESWTPRLEPSEVFGDNVLAVYTHARKQDANGFVVEMECSAEEWEQLSQRFVRFLPVGDSVDTGDTTLLLDASLRGKLFVRGIFVCHENDYAFGYDFRRGVVTDRDRRMVDRYEAQSAAARALDIALTRRTDVGDRIFAALAVGSSDGQGFRWRASAEAIERVTALFFAEHGKDALPVSSMAGAREAEHYGKRGIVVAEDFAKLLAQDDALRLDAVRAAHGKSVTTRFSWSDLTGGEAMTYRKVLALVEAAAAALGYKPVEDRLTIVAFGDENLQGLHKDGALYVSRACLASVADFVRVLVHEVAHDRGGDGDKGHEEAEGRLFAHIIAALAR